MDFCKSCHRRTLHLRRGKEIKILSWIWFSNMRNNPFAKHYFMHRSILSELGAMNNSLTNVCYCWNAFSIVAFDTYYDTVWIKFRETFKVLIVKHKINFVQATRNLSRNKATIWTGCKWKQSTKSIAYLYAAYIMPIMKSSDDNCQEKARSTSIKQIIAVFSFLTFCWLV